jgi:hypothetical protein
LQKIKTVFKFKDLELEVYFLHMDCNLAQYKESWRGGQRKTLTVKIRAGLQEPDLWNCEANPALDH